jgi:hypothetical protein
MKKEDFLECNEKEIVLRRKLIEKAKKLKVGQIYKWGGYKWLGPGERYNKEIIGQLFSFVFSTQSTGVSFRVLAHDGLYGIGKTITCQIDDNPKQFEEVKETDLPLYIGWKTTEGFAKKLKRIKI